MRLRAEFVEGRLSKTRNRFRLRAAIASAASYFHSHAFLAKLSLFIVVALLSIVPTMEFLSWRGAVSTGQVPAIEMKRLRRVTTVIHVELAAIVIILLCAAIMARGGWV